MNGKVNKWCTTKTKTKTETKTSLWGTFGAKRGGGLGTTTELKFCKKMIIRIKNKENWEWLGKRKILMKYNNNSILKDNIIYFLIPVYKSRSINKE